MKRFLTGLFLAAVPAVLSVTARADVKLPSVIGANMVLQRDAEVPIWGWAEPGEAVTVEFGDAKKTTKADEKGNWSVKLPKMVANGNGRTLTVAGNNKLELANVLVGEVWLCSGQSNMEWRVKQSANPEKEKANAKHPLIRHVKIARAPMAAPQKDVPAVFGGWQVCSPETVSEFTAVGYYFARHLKNELNVPIGLIGSNWGGTRIEPWTPPVGFKSVPALKSIADNLDNFPRKKRNGDIDHQSATALYNGMIAPLVPYAIRGAIWYQGESNNGEGMVYHQKMKALINGWRSLWNNEDMPFYYVQLAPYSRYRGSPKNLPGIWEAQLKTLSVPHTGMAVTVDVSNLTNIHPTNKQDVGKRLALWALAKDYGKKDLVYSGPLYQSMKVEDGRIRIKFDHVGGGLATRDGKPLSFFEIAGEDKQFVKAKAEIDGDSVVVSATGVSKPIAVRFGWDQSAEPNLSNKEGLPASPFRTDNWKE